MTDERTRSNVDYASSECEIKDKVPELCAALVRPCSQAPSGCCVSASPRCCAAGGGLCISHRNFAARPSGR